MLRRVIIFIILLLLFLNCKQKNKERLIIYASGKDFVNKEFIDKDGWKINITSTLIHIRDITITDSIVIKIYDKFFIELKSVDRDMTKITEITSPTREKKKVISFYLKKTFDYDFPGYSFIIRGRAKKDNKEIPFTIKLNEEIVWMAPLEDDGKKEEKIINLNFCLEYIFGSITPIKTKTHTYGDDTEIEININEYACGFTYFLPFEKNGVINVSQEEILKIKGENEYNKLIKALHKIAFVGDEQANVLYSSSKLVK